MVREIVIIDEDLCDGCGQCVPACHEGALQIVDGKARLVADRLCDGLGACLGHCPRGAIRIEKRAADGFDPAAVAARQRPSRPAACPSGGTSGHGGGCPGSRLAQFAPGPRSRPANAAGAPSESELTHWPVQLRLLPPGAPVLQGARLLVCADCVPVAYAGFHADLLRDRAVVIACPKLDDTRGYVEKLAQMMALNELAEVVVAHMEVPCCTGIRTAVLEARRLADSDVPVVDVVIGTRGELLSRQLLPAEARRAAE
jgi:NAD-dependent dihydropyrimidine dehydrogenase PreA subunit